MRSMNPLPFVFVDIEMPESVEYAMHLRSLCVFVNLLTLTVLLMVSW